MDSPQKVICHNCWQRVTITSKGKYRKHGYKYSIHKVYRYGNLIGKTKTYHTRPCSNSGKDFVVIREEGE